MTHAHRRGDPSLYVGTVLLCVLVCLTVNADVVTLTNGQTLEGRVSEDGQIVIIELAQGTVKIPKSRVKSIASKTTALDEYAQRRSKLLRTAAQNKLNPPAEAQLWFELSQWADEQKLPNCRTDALKMALERDPDHSAARQASGYVAHNGRWMTHVERYQALGLVRVEGKWVPKEAEEDAKKARRAREAKEKEQVDEKNRRREAAQQRAPRPRVL